MTWTQQGPGAPRPLCWHSGFSKQKLRGVEYSEGIVGLDPSWLASRGLSRVENSDGTSYERAAVSGLEPRSWMPEICCNQPNPLTDRQAQPPPAGMQALQSSESRLRSILLCTSCRGKKKKLSQTLWTTQFLPPWSTKPSRAERIESDATRYFRLSCIPLNIHFIAFKFRPNMSPGFIL